jgi:hypothetical protein
VPPDLPAAGTPGSPTSGGVPRLAPDVTIPDHLRPRWRDLPALAWLAVRGLDTRLQAVPILGRVAAWCALPMMLLTMACAHADGHLAARDRHAVLWIHRLTATGRRVHTGRELLLIAAALLPVTTALLSAIALSNAEQASLPVRIAAHAVALAITAAPLLAIFAVNRWRDLTTRYRAAAPPPRRTGAYTPRGGGRLRRRHHHTSRRRAGTCAARPR